jgi:hypothetical protein
LIAKAHGCVHGLIIDCIWLIWIITRLMGI